MRFWYVQFSPSRAYMAWMSRPPLGPSGNSTCATMFWIVHCDRLNRSLGMQSLSSLATYSPE